MHVGVRGPTQRGSLTGGRKALFALAQRRTRLVTAEAPIDASGLHDFVSFAGLQVALRIPIECDDNMRSVTGNSGWLQIVG